MVLDLENFEDSEDDEMHEIMKQSVELAMHSVEIREQFHQWTMKAEDWGTYRVLQVGPEPDIDQAKQTLAYYIGVSVRACCITLAEYEGLIIVPKIFWDEGLITNA